jgi:hypothetical protein
MKPATDFLGLAEFQEIDKRLQHSGLESILVKEKSFSYHGLERAESDDGGGRDLEWHPSRENGLHLFTSRNTHRTRKEYSGRRCPKVFRVGRSMQESSLKGLLFE